MAALLFDRPTHPPRLDFPLRTITRSNDAAYGQEALDYAQSLNFSHPEVIDAFVRLRKAEKEMKRADSYSVGLELKRERKTKPN